MELSESNETEYDIDLSLPDDLAKKTLERFIEALVTAKEGADRPELLQEALAYAYAAVGKPLPTQDLIMRRLRDLGFKIVACDFTEQELGAGLYFIQGREKAVVAVAITADQSVADLFNMAVDMYNSPEATGTIPKDTLIN